MISNLVKLFQTQVQRAAGRTGFVIQRRGSTADLEATLTSFFHIDENYREGLTRLGGTGDGSYMVPLSVAESIEILFSPGVSYEIEFDRWFADRGAKCYLLDGALNGDEPHLSHRNFHFEQLWLSDKDSESSICLDTWVNVNAPAGQNLCLQMDIEGAEYEVILASSSSTLKRFSIIVVEFHDLRSMLSRSGMKLITLTLQRLAEHHEIVHTNVNDCYPMLSLAGTEIPEVLEVTFVRR